MHGGGESVRAPKRAVQVIVAMLVAGSGVATSCAGESGATGSDAVPAASVGPVAGGAQGVRRAGRGADFDLASRSAPASGAATAVLHDVRVERHRSFDRVLFEFDGTTRPQYRIAWTDDPAPVRVAGDARLEVVLQPASGVDVAGGELGYAGPDRVALDASEKVVRDIVRTGDFEGVLTWVIGADDAVPFRVRALAEPTRLEIDLRTS